MTVKKIKTIAERVNQFPKIIERYPQEFDVKFSSLASSHSDYDRQLTKQKFVIQSSITNKSSTEQTKWTF